MKHVGIGLFFLLLLFLQGSIMTVPLVLVMLVLLYIFYRQDWVFFLAFLSGIFLDIFSVRPIGSTSIFLLFFLLFIFLYQRKFEIGSYYFIFFSLFIGAAWYAFFFGSYHGVFMAVIVSFLGVGSFWILQKIIGKQQHSYF